MSRWNFKAKAVKKPWLWNLWPPFFFSGIKIESISRDFRHITVHLKLKFWNANYVGTLFGGSLFAMTDPFYMLMLIKNLGKDYIVWDKSACISYLKPGRTQARAEFTLTEEDLAFIRNTLSRQDKMDWQTAVEIKDAEGAVIAKVDKVLYIRKR